MSYFFIIFGVVLVIASARNTQGCLFTLLQGDFFNNTGSNNCGSTSGSVSYLYWLAAIFIIGAIGYDERIRPISDGFLALVIIVLLVHAGDPKGNGGGFFNQFKNALIQIGGTTATPIGNASSPGVSLAVDTVPNSTTINSGSASIGGTLASGTGSVGTGNGGGCPPGYVRSAEVGDCIPDNSLDPFGFGSDPFGFGGAGGGGGSGDPFGGGSGFGDDALFKLPKLPVLQTGHGVT